jgi:hypothetical protein
MRASSSAIDSSFSLPPATSIGEPHELSKRTLRVIVLDFALIEQRDLGSLLLLHETTRASRIISFTISNELSEEKQKIRSIRAEAETSPRNICRRFENISARWVHAMILAFLTGCCAITFFFAFQAPFRLRVVNKELAGPTTFRTETAALPAPLETRTMPGFLTRGSRQNAAYHQADGLVDDSPHKRRVPRERPFQQKQSQVSIRAGQFSGRN